MVEKDSTQRQKSDPPVNWDAMDSNEFADRMLAFLDGEAAVLSCEEMDIIERYWKEDMVARRTALIMLTKPFAELSQMILEIENSRLQWLTSTSALIRKSTRMSRN